MSDKGSVHTKIHPFAHKRIKQKLLRNRNTEGVNMA